MEAVIGLEASERHNLAIDAAVWGTPLVSFDAMRQAFFRDAGARYGDVVYLSRLPDWKLQLTMPNAATRYAYLNFNTRAGPVVIDIPPADGAGFSGTLFDAWQVPLAHVGVNGLDRGRGARYLVLPPDYAHDHVRDGFRVLPSLTYNGYAVIGVVADNSSKDAVDRTLHLIRQIRVYPLAQARSPRPTRTIDMSGRLFDGVIPFSETFFVSLARVVSEEPAVAGNYEIAKLRELGIDPGEQFAPDFFLRRELKSAVREMLAQLVGLLPYAGDRFYPDAHWRTVSEGDLTLAPGKEVPSATTALAAHVDADDRPLNGSHSYVLHLPPHMPAERFWALTVYDAETCAFVRESPKVEVNSYHESLQTNADGSTDIFLGFVAPAGRSGNWIALRPRRNWFAVLRFYAPKPALAQRAWRAPDFERVN